MGDAVYELWIREEAIVQYQKSAELHRYTTLRVKAETQSRILEELLPHLPDEMVRLVKSAQNMPVPGGRRSNQALYRKATALEALIGYWYLREPENLPLHREQILQLLNKTFQADSLL